MTTDPFKQGLMELYQGELFGEVIFEQLLTVFTEPSQQYKLAVLLQLETETKARLRPAMMHLGLPITEQNNSRAEGQRLANALSGLSWNEVLVQVRDAVAPVIERYQQIAASAPAEFKPLAESMVVHEQSLLDFAEQELAGETVYALTPIIAQLQFKLPKPDEPR